MELREILAHLKARNGLTTETLSQLSGVPKGTLNKLLNGETRNPTGGTLKKLADALNCPVELFYSPSGLEALPPFRLKNAEDLLPLQRRSIPLLGEIAAGLPIPAEESPELASCSASMPGDLALRVRGDSMIGVRLYDGDLVFIRLQDDVEDGDIAAVIVDNEATIKRVFHIENGLKLRPENPAYKTMVYTFDECNYIHILGKAVGFESRL